MFDTPGKVILKENYFNKKIAGVVLFSDGKIKLRYA
jgi:hypothetical protein